MSRADEGRQKLLEMLGPDADMPAEEIVQRLTYLEIGKKPMLPLALALARSEEIKERLLTELDLSLPADIFERYGIESHRCNCVKRIEPATSLIDTFSDEIRREILLKFFFIFKRIMPLCVRHRTRIKPNINQIQLSFHRTTII